MLEASSHIYGMKVDSIFNDVLRFSSGMRRQTSPTSFLVETDDNSVIVNPGGGRNVGQSDVIPKKRRRTMVVGNNNKINAKLETIEPVKPISTVGGFHTKNLLQNLLSSSEYALNLIPKGRYDTRDAPIGLDDENAIFDAPIVDLPMLLWDASTTDVIRPKIGGYCISNTPASVESIW